MRTLADSPQEAPAAAEPAVKKRKTGLTSSADVDKNGEAAADDEDDEDAAAEDDDADPEEEFEPEEPVGEVPLTGPAAAAKKDVGGKVPVAIDDEGNKVEDGEDEDDE